MRMRYVLAFALLAACSSKSSNPDAPQGTTDAPGTADAPATADAPLTDAPPADAKNGFTLHITNALNWCVVTVNGTVYTPPADFPDTVFAKDTVVNLHGDKFGTFVWGYWTGTDGQNDGGTQDTNHDATITMAADESVYVCCPISGQTTCP